MASNRATHPLPLGAYQLKSHSAQRRIFQYLLSNFNAQLLRNMAFNSYATIEARISEACDAIHDGWYTKLYTSCKCIRCSNSSVTMRVEWKRVKKYTSIHHQSPYRGARGCTYRLEKINMCARPQMIVGAANYLIRFENCMVGH